MISNELLGEIEGGGLPSELSIANSLRMLVKIAARNQTIKSLVWDLIEPPNQQVLAERIAMLASEESEEGYRHPHDGMIAVYLHLLFRVNPIVAGHVAGRLGERPSFCWTSQVISQCLQHRRESSTLRVMQGNLEDQDLSHLSGQRPRHAGVA